MRSYLLSAVAASNPSSDFGDQFPDSLVTGTDISPIQPAWVPPNTKFEIDDATQPWTWHDDTFGFIHMRYLVGAIADWDALFLEAYRCCEPGGWLESVELDVDYLSDDGTAKHAPVLQTFWELYDKGIAKLGRTARVVKDGIQRKSMKSAGFINIHDKSFKLPVGGWAADSTLAEIGQYVQLALLNDLEGVLLLPRPILIQYILTKSQATQPIYGTTC